MIQWQRVALSVAQTCVLLLGVWAMHLAWVYRPYILCGDRMCSFAPEYYPIAPSPKNGDTVAFIAPLYVFQLGLIPWVTGMAILLLRTSLTRRAVLNLFAIATSGLVLLQASLIVFLTIVSWGLSVVIFGVFQPILLLMASVSAFRLLRSDGGDSAIRTLLTVITAALLLLQGVLICTGLTFLTAYSGGFWVLLCALFLSLLGLVRLAMIPHDPRLLALSPRQRRRQRRVRDTLHNFMEELLLRR